MNNFLKVGDTVRYKGFICVVDYHDLDDESKSLVQIYENEERFNKKLEMWTESLSNNDLQNNIIKFLDKYCIKN